MSKDSGKSKDKQATLEACLAKKGWLLADGATGTNLFTLGLETGYPPELWNVEETAKIRALHNSFIEAGSDIILTNSFGGNALRLKLHDAEDRVAELNIAAATIARNAADASGRDVLVAGSVGPTGELFAPLGALEAKQAEDVFAEQIEALASAGVDLIQIETMSSLEEVEAAANAAVATGLPVFATMTFDTAGRSMMGITPVDYAQFADRLGLAGFGANCGIGPAELLHSVTGFGECGEQMIIAKGNCGIPHYMDGQIHYHGTPELMATYAVLARDAGAKIIGGCCGTTAEHIKAMADALNNTPPDGKPSKDRLDEALGHAWKDVPQSPVGNSARQRRRRRPAA